MRSRLGSSTIQKLLREFPAVILVGPRQCGKTTLSRKLGGEYFDLENPQEQLRLEATWDSVLEARTLTVFDEAQAYPPLFNRLRSAIDQERKRKGRFLLLGSVSPTLMREVGESLAGRMAVCELSPLSALELRASEAEDCWLYGGFPDGGILDQGRNYPQWQDSYLRLMAQRDLPNLGLPAAPRETLRLFKMIAALHGQNWNASEIGASLGLSYHTVNSYESYLENAFLVRRLPPFHANVKKRLIKSPRLYWRDSGLLHSLLNLPKSAKTKNLLEPLLSQPWVGRSWEGWVIEQILASLSLRPDRQAEAAYFRTSDGKELDLVLETGGERWAIEIKLTADPTPEMLHKLDEAASLIGASRRLLISRTRQTISGKQILSTHLRGALEALGF